MQNAGKSIYWFKLALQLNINNRTWWSNNHPDHALPPGKGSEIEAITSDFVLNGEWQLRGKEFGLEVAQTSRKYLILLFTYLMKNICSWLHAYKCATNSKKY